MKAKRATTRASKQGTIKRRGGDVAKSESKISSFHDKKDLAEIAEVFAHDLCKAVKGDKINPHWIRAIYSGLSLKLDEHGEDILGNFNAGHHRKASGLSFVQTSHAPNVCYLMNSGITNQSTSTLSKKYVLLQLLQEDRKKDQFIISWGEVFDFDGDQPKEWFVKILNQKKFAEGLHGKSIWVKNYEILRVAAEPVPLIDKKGNWKY